MSDAGWTYVGIAIAVVLVVAGLWLLVSSRRGRDEATSRPARDSFRAVDDTPAPPRKRLAVVLNPTKLEGAAVDVHAVITRVCAQEGWDEPLFIETEEHDVGFGQTRQALAENADVVCAFGGDGTVRAVAQEMVDTGVPMGLLPGGTGNLLARNLELPTDDLAACRHGRDHRPQPAHRRRLDAAEPRRGTPRGARRRGLVEPGRGGTRSS